MRLVLTLVILWAQTGAMTLVLVHGIFLVFMWHYYQMTMQHIHIHVEAQLPAVRAPPVHVLYIHRYTMRRQFGRHERPAAVIVHIHTAQRLNEYGNTT